MSYALITGASGGIGLCLARELAQRKSDLLLVARSQSNLQRISTELMDEYGIKSHFLSLDLSTPQSHKILLEWVNSNQYQVNILINNAGYAIWKEFETTPEEQIQNMMTLNMNTAVNLCHAFIPMLKAQPQSYILNVASTAAYQAIPAMALYAASKSFIILFTRGLRMELKNSSVSVSCLSPGTTSTKFMDRAGMQALQATAEKFSMSPEKVANIAIHGMFNGTAEIIAGFTNWITVKLISFLPKSLPESIAANIYFKK